MWAISPRSFFPLFQHRNNICSSPIIWQFSCIFLRVYFSRNVRNKVFHYLMEELQFAFGKSHLHLFPGRMDSSRCQQHIAFIHCAIWFNPGILFNIFKFIHLTLWAEVSMIKFIFPFCCFLLREKEKNPTEFQVVFLSGFLYTY